MIKRNGVYKLSGVEHSYHGPETELLSRIALVNECVAKAVSEPGNLSEIFRQVHRSK